MQSGHVLCHARLPIPDAQFTSRSRSGAALESVIQLFADKVQDEQSSAGTSEKDEEYDEEE